MLRHREPKLTAALRIAVEPEMKLALSKRAAKAGEGVTLADVVRGFVREGLDKEETAAIGSDPAAAERVRFAVGRALDEGGVDAGTEEVLCWDYLEAIRVCRDLQIKEAVLLLERPIAGFLEDVRRAAKDDQQPSLTPHDVALTFASAMEEAAYYTPDVTPDHEDYQGVAPSEAEISEFLKNVQKAQRLAQAVLSETGLGRACAADSLATAEAVLIQYYREHQKTKVEEACERQGSLREQETENDTNQRVPRG